MTVAAKVLSPRWQVRYTAGNHSAVADTHKQGVGGTAGLRPHELLEAALATCMTITVRMALAERGLPDDEVSVSVEVVREPAATTFRYELALPTALEPEREFLRGRLEHSPVRTTLSQPIRFLPEGGITSVPMS